MEWRRWKMKRDDTRCGTIPRLTHRRKYDEIINPSGSPSSKMKRKMKRKMKKMNENNWEAKNRRWDYPPLSSPTPTKITLWLSTPDHRIASCPTNHCAETTTMAMTTMTMSILMIGNHGDRKVNPEVGEETDGVRDSSWCTLNGTLNGSLNGTLMAL